MIAVVVRVECRISTRLRALSDARRARNTPLVPQRLRRLLWSAATCRLSQNPRTTRGAKTSTGSR